MICDRNVLTCIVLAGNPRHSDLIIAACTIALLAIIVGILGFPDSSEGRYSVFLSCCTAVHLSLRHFAKIFRFSVAWFAHIWGALTIAPERFRSARHRMWVWVLDMWGKIWHAGSSVWVYVLGVMHGSAT
jgi:hypothetical protein